VRHQKWLLHPAFRRPWVLVSARGEWCLGPGPRHARACALPLRINLLTHEVLGTKWRSRLPKESRASGGGSNDLTPNRSQIPLRGTLYRGLTFLVDHHVPKRLIRSTGTQYAVS
jgi:hypothetical protein